MGYSAYLTPRKETVSGEGIEGIIDLANLSSGDTGKIETNPEIFFSLTYPTSDIVRVLEHINNRFSSSKRETGLFLFEGLKGSGKSHLLLLVYNLFRYPEIAQKWLEQHGMTCNIPGDVIVVINKFTDNPFDSIWEFIFEKLGETVKKSKTHPKLADFESALGDKNLVLIFDELEQGIKVIADPALQAQNIAFLQMLSELSNRSGQVTLFASIYSDREEPGSTFKRVPRCTIQFDDAMDKCNVILHRLFENYLSFKRENISPVIESYMQLWKKHSSFDEESLKNRFYETYPFTPSLMDIILKKIPSRGGFQNVRGAISFLGNMVKLTHESGDIIAPSDASLEDKATIVMLRDLDIGGDLINKALDNMEAVSSTVPLANKFASSVLLHTITGFNSDKGVTRDVLITDLMSPSVDINAVNQALMSFQKYGSNFYADGDRYYFDVEDKPEAKVEVKSLQYNDDHARELIIDIMKTEVFRETSGTVVFSSIEQVQQQLNQFDKNRLRYVIAGRRLTQEERHGIYYGMDVRNLIILLEPKDDGFQLLSDKDVLKWAKRVRAAKALAGSAGKSARRADYERIAKSDQAGIIDRIKKAGLVFVSWEEYGANVNEDSIELEPVPGDCSKDKVLEALSQTYFPVLAIKEHLESRLDFIKEKLVKEIDAEYRQTLGFPVPALSGSVSKAIRELCKEGSVGIQHSRGNCCNRNPDLTETEIFNAKLTDPFEEPPGTEPPVRVPEPHVPPSGESPRKICPRCGEEICQCPGKETVNLGIPPQTGIGSLREAVAFRLQDYADAAVAKVTYKIFFHQTDIGDMSTLPQILRGNLSGQGDVTAEITIAKNGRFTKSQIEQQVESLPSVSGAEYSAELTVEIEQKEG